MQNVKRLVALCAVMIIAMLVMTACGGEPEIVEKEVTREVPVEVVKEVQIEVTKEVEVTRIVEKEVVKEVEVPAEPVAEVPFAAMWVASGHADAGAEAFIHWDEDDPAVVPARCAKCLFLGNIHPSLQLEVLEQSSAEFVALDTMNLWIDTALDTLKEVLARTHAALSTTRKSRI